MLFSMKVKFIPLSMALSGLQIRWLKFGELAVCLEGKF